MVRARRDEDLEPLFVLLRSVYRADSYPANWPNDPIRWVAARREFGAWVFERRGELVGHLALTPPDPDRAWQQWQEALQQPTERLAVMRRLFVAPAAPQERRRDAVDQGCRGQCRRTRTALVLDVADDNRAAIEFWRTHGWREVGQATLPPGDEGHELTVLLLVASAPRQ